MIDIIRTKSVIGYDHTVRTTCTRLGLDSIHTRVVVEDSPHIRGMVMKLASVVMWTARDTSTTLGKSRLHPPRKGFPQKIARVGELSTADFDAVLGRMTR